MGNSTEGLSLQVVQGPRTVAVVPGTNLVQLQIITLS
jgi:hypothetical protein